MHRAWEESDTSELIRIDGSQSKMLEKRLPTKNVERSIYRMNLIANYHA